MLDYLHLLTICSWLPPAIRAGARTGHRSARVLWTLSVLTCLLFGYMLYLDFVWSKTVVAPIRVDLLLVIPLTTVTFTAIGVWGLRKPCPGRPTARRPDSRRGDVRRSSG